MNLIMGEVLFKDARDYVILEYQLRKNRRAGYSMHAFARDLNFSPSSLNDFIKRRVGMSEERICHFTKSLKWTGKRREFFQDIVFLNLLKLVPFEICRKCELKNS